MTKKAIRVLLADDEELIRSGLAILLETYEDIEIVGQAANGQEAADLCDEASVDVVLMDIRMPEVTGIEGTKRIKTNYPDIKVLILTTFQDTEYISQAMRVGASGYLLKDSSNEDIYEGIKIAYRENIVLDGKIGHEIAKLSLKEENDRFDAEGFHLSEKETTLIQLVASGLTNQEIADKLYLSLGTVKNNVSTILSKLELRDRTQLAIFAYENGLMN